MDSFDGNLAGRISLGKSRKGNVPEQLQVDLRGRSLYQLQRFFEDEVKKGGDYFRVRWMVLMAEELRIAVAKATGEVPTEEAVFN